MQAVEDIVAAELEALGEQRLLQARAVEACGDGTALTRMAMIFCGGRFCGRRLRRSRSLRFSDLVVRTRRAGSCSGSSGGSMRGVCPPAAVYRGAGAESSCADHVGSRRACAGRSRSSPAADRRSIIAAARGASSARSGSIVALARGGLSILHGGRPRRSNESAVPVKTAGLRAAGSAAPPARVRERMPQMYRPTISRIPAISRIQRSSFISARVTSRPCGRLRRRRPRRGVSSRARSSSRRATGSRVPSSSCCA